MQAAALRALGRLAVLSEPLCRRAAAVAEGRLQAGGSGGAEPVREAAVAVLADAIDAFPNAFSCKLVLVGRLMVPGEAAAPGEGAAAGGAMEAGQAKEEQAEAEDAGRVEQQPAGPTGAAAVAAAAASAAAAEPEALRAAADASAGQRLAQVAAAAYCRLLLRNKLKLRGVLGPVGAALAGGAPAVAALVKHALRQMLAAAAPRERARLCLDLFHQTPLPSRQRLAEVRLAADGETTGQQACTETRAHPMHLACF